MGRSTLERTVHRRSRALVRERRMVRKVPTPLI
jgi:hypothetical protein